MTEPTLRILKVEVLSDDWATLKKTTLEYLRRDGTWSTQVRQTFDRGDGAAVLPYDAARGMVLLVRQFRYPAYVHGHHEPLIEVCAGVLDADDPETCARKEAQEELGYRLGKLSLVFDAFMSPGSVTERLSLFTAPYRPEDRFSDGGGHASEGEDIEVLEITLEQALAMMAAGKIIDAKTVMLLQHAKLAGLMERQA